MPCTYAAPRSTVGRQLDLTDGCWLSAHLSGPRGFYAPIAACVARACVTWGGEGRVRMISALFHGTRSARSVHSTQPHAPPMFAQRALYKLFLFFPCSACIFFTAAAWIRFVTSSADRAALRLSQCQLRCSSATHSPDWKVGRDREREGGREGERGRGREVRTAITAAHSTQHTCVMPHGRSTARYPKAHLIVL